MSAKPR